MRLTIVFLLCVSFAFSQSNDSKIAYQFYQNGEYSKAIQIYKELSKGRKLIQYYYPYLQCLVLSEQFLEAKKLTNKIIRINSSYIPYQVDLFMIYHKLSQFKQAEKTLQIIKEKLENQDNQLVNVSNTFSRYSFYREALGCYEYIEKQKKASNKYYIQKAQLYQYLSDDENMVDNYLLYLSKNPNQKITIINYLQRYLDNNGIENDKNYNLVKNKLLRYSHNEKNTHVFSELLIWIFMQNNEFKLAFLQSKALDKRLKEDGERVFDLSESFLDNEYFDLAIECYEYIIDKGSDNYYYIDAHINLLYALGQKDDPDLIELNSLYRRTIEELGIDNNTVHLLNNYAHFTAFSMSDLTSARQILESIMDIPNLENNDMGECKLVYADVMLLSGNIWSSLLYYSQVEKEHKESPLGHEAKLRRAKIFYYQGDFNWAQSQLDVLKSSTSKLISNDAMDLSLLITDNLNLDTSSVPMEMYARSDLLFYQNKFDESIILLDSILNLFPGHSLIDEIYFRKYEIYNIKNEVNKSIEMLELIVSYYSYDILKDDALFNLAQIYEYKKSDLEKAFYYYETILMECSGSIYTAESRKKYRELRDDLL